MKYFNILFLSILIFSCKKKVVEPIQIPVNELKNGILVLNEGLFQHNNSSLSWISLNDAVINNEFFEQKTGRKLGDTGNDIKRYGNKIYILVNVSGTLEVLNASDGKSIKQISFVEYNQNKQPRKMCFSNGKAFVSCFDGYVDVIDTVSLNIIKRIKVGLNPDNVIYHSNKIYVSNSGGLNFPVLDSTISVIDANSLIEIKKIVVGKNPGELVANNNDLYVICRGNYSTINPRLVKVNLSNDLIQTLNVNQALTMEVMGNDLLIAYNENNTSILGKFSLNSMTWVAPNWISLSNFQQIYKIQYEKENDKLYLFDAMDYTISGYVREYTSNGNYLNEFKCSNVPNSLIYFK